MLPHEKVRYISSSRLVRYWSPGNQEWRTCRITPKWFRQSSYAVFDGNTIIVSIGSKVTAEEMPNLANLKEVFSLRKYAKVRGLPHPLQADIVKWAGDPERWGWETFKGCGGWRGTKFPPHADENPEHFRLIDRHARKGPLTEAPQIGETVWRANPYLKTLADTAKWTGSAHDYQALSRRFLYRTREEAAALGRRMAEVAMESAQ